jgi:hypothetical protein
VIKRQRVISTKEKCLYLYRSCQSNRKEALGGNFEKEAFKVLRLIDSKVKSSKLSAQKY